MKDGRWESSRVRLCDTRNRGFAAAVKVCCDDKYSTARANKRLAQVLRRNARALGARK